MLLATIKHYQKNYKFFFVGIWVTKRGDIDAKALAM